MRVSVALENVFVYLIVYINSLPTKKFKAGRWYIWRLRYKSNLRLLSLSIPLFCISLNIFSTKLAKITDEDEEQFIDIKKK